MNELTNEQILVFQVIDASDSSGVWLRDIKAATSMTQQALSKALKVLESRKLVKTVRSVQQKTKKLYMRYDKQPTREVSGGPWSRGRADGGARPPGTWISRGGGSRHRRGRGRGYSEGAGRGTAGSADAGARRGAAAAARRVAGGRSPDKGLSTWQPRRRRDPLPRNIHAAAAASSPRPASTEYPRGSRGVAATWPRNAPGRDVAIRRYTDQEFDHEFVGALKKYITQMVVRAQQCSLDEIYNAVKKSGVSTVSLSRDDLKVVVDALCADSDLERINLATATEYKKARPGVDFAWISEVPGGECPWPEPPGGDGEGAWPKYLDAWLAQDVDEDSIMDGR